jgi:hypothetical protein
MATKVKKYHILICEFMNTLLLKVRLTHRPDDGGSKNLWNVGKLLPDYTVQQPRRRSSSYSPPWEPEILLEDV